MNDAETVKLIDSKDEPAPSAPVRTPVELATLASEQLAQPIELTALLMTLTARHPHDPAGLLDFYQPGRWDCTDNYVSLRSNFDGNASIGYGKFTTTSGGSHLVAVHANGYETTINLHGPWGTASAYCAKNSDPPSVATALWNAPAGSILHFTFGFTGGLSGSLRKVEIHSL